MKTIIRIEHDCGKGLWRAKNKDKQDYCKNFSFLDDLINKHRYFPTPYHDNLPFDITYFCAFKSIEQIQQWIEKDWFNEILDFGFKILMLEVSECNEGEFQIVFKKENIISTKDISSLFKNV